MTPTLPPSGLDALLAQSDPISRTLLLVLIAMSVASWAVIVVTLLTRRVRSSRSSQFLRRFWAAPSLTDVAADLDRHGAHDPFAHLTHDALQARAHHAQHGAARLAEAGSASEFVTRTIKKGLDEEMTRLENGLTLLATVGSTAPFVGLFGTVWGVYHALVNIGTGGAATLDKVAGPVGEALIMTGLGLAVAIPAVVAYNALGRANRVAAARLDTFAHELHTLVSMGQPMAARANTVQGS